jgi:hypothetical protein
VASSEIYHLSATEAREIVDHQVEVIHREWDDVCDLANLSTVDRRPGTLLGTADPQRLRVPLMGVAEGPSTLVLLFDNTAVALPEPVLDLVPRRAWPTNHGADRFRR